MNQLKKAILQITKVRGAAEILAMIGVAIYTIQSFIYAHRLPSMLDEGNYLYKGLLYITGSYFPFQEFGPWTNKMPFSYYIPGLSQLFEPGIRSGRYFAILMGILMLVALWIIARRLSGPWWGAFIIWAYAANPIVIKVYSQMLSQGLIAFLLAWMFVFSLGKNQKTWHTLTATFLAAVIIFSRQNMLPLIGFLLIYYLWEHGWRIAAINTVFFTLLFTAVHLIYWPGIMQLWLPWIPETLSPLLDSFRLNLGGTEVWNPEVSIFTRIFSFWEGTRFHFIPIVGAIIAWIFWPKRTEWKSVSHFRIAVILSFLFLVMVVSHAWAALAHDFCVFCYSYYLSFFSQLGLLIILVVFPFIQINAGHWRQILAVLMTPLISGGVALGAHQDLANFFMNIRVPRMRNMQFLPGTTEIWRFLTNKYDLAFDTLKIWIPTISGFLIGVLMISLAGLVFLLWFRHRTPRPGIGFIAMTALLIVGMVLTPTPALGGGNREQDCGDVIQAYENAGRHLNQIIPEESLIYWYGGLSPVPLLYLDNIHIYPPQLNDGYSYRDGGDPFQLNRYGFWNEVLSDQWMLEADFILLEGRYYTGEKKEKLENGPFSEYSNPTEAILKCEYRYGTEIRIFRRDK